MCKILILTSSFDLTADYMINRYSKSINFFRFNVDKYDQYKVNVNNKGSSVTDNCGRFCNFDKRTPIWFRKPTMPKFEMSQSDLEFSHREIFTQIEGILEGHNGIVIEKPCTLRRANNKILQLKLALKCGFTVPGSCLSNDKVAVKKQIQNHKQIIKPISIGKISTKSKTTFLQTELLKEDDEFKDLRYCPSYFQDYIKKDYEIRLTIVGNEFFPVKIESANEVDWRKDSNNKLSKIDIPDKLKIKCLNLMSKLNIRFGAFDFIVSDGIYYFLEVNPNGQWLWLEQELQLKISDSIIALLLGEKND